MQDNNLVDVNLTSEMKTSFIDYAMSVIVSRALPDVRDGLKPVHRRILYGMINHIRNQLVLPGMLWVNTIHTATPLFMRLWFGWLNGGAIVTCL